MGRVALILVGLSLFALGGAASAGTAGSWTRVTDSTLRNIDDLGLVRTKDGVLHVAWRVAQGANEAIRHATIATSGKVGAATTAVPGLKGASSPDLELTPAGELLTFFSTVVPSPGGIQTARGNAAGTSWSAPTRASFDTQGGPPGASVLGSGTPVFAWAAGTKSWFHEGTNPADADTALGPSPKCCYYDFETAVEGSAVVVAYHSNVSDAPGIFVRQVRPSLGAPQLAPQSLTGKSFLQPGRRMPLVARDGGGLFLAYCSGYPRCTRVLLWRVGGAVKAVARGTDIEDVGLARGPGGRLWVFWQEGDAKQIFAARTNASASRAGAVVRVKRPGGASSIWDLFGEGSVSSLDLFALVTTPGSLAAWHTQVLPGLSLSCVGKQTGATCRVTDAGAPVAGATVRIGRSSVKTLASGVASFELKKGSYTATATRSGFTPSSVRIRVP